MKRPNIDGRPQTYPIFFNTFSGSGLSLLKISFGQGTRFST